jgi:hypothetical protein
MVVLSKKNVSDINELLGEYTITKKQIADRLEEFRQKYKNGSEEDIFEV